MTTDSEPTTERSEVVAKKEGRMEQLVERMGTGLGEGIGSLAESGVLFVVFALIWAAFAGALLWSQGSVDAVWATVRGWPWPVEGVVWILFLPVMLAMWIWETAWPQIWRMGLVAGLAAWTLLIFPRPWK